MPEVFSDRPSERLVTSSGSLDFAAQEQSPSAQRQQEDSRLIEFPGASRAVPEWRKQLSQRVREVQERRAREAAETAAAAQESEAVSCALPSAQLELVPDREQVVMNPIVSKALERLERARRSDFSVGGAATAAALAPVPDGLSGQTGDRAPEIPARKSKLVVVPPKAKAVEPTRKPVRVLSDGVEDVALSYLETCLNVPALDSDTRSDRAAVWRRTTAGILDLLIMALLAAPFAAGIRVSQPHWSDPRTIALMSGIALVLMFSYLTISIALTGRTLGMRLLSLRTIDVRTGLIPTGGQSMKRALGYIFSLAILGLGLIYALIDPEGRTIHDRISKTMVVHN